MKCEIHGIKIPVHATCCPECATSEVEALQAEVRRLREEQSRIARSGLAALAGVVCTPVEGYEKAGLNWFVNDVRSLVKLHRKTEAERDRYRGALERIAAQNLCSCRIHCQGIAQQALRGGEG